MSKLTDYEAIMQYYEGKRRKEDLTADQWAHKTRLVQVWTMQSEGKPNRIILSVIMKEHQVSRETVYRDIREAVKIYGYVGKAEKEGLRAIYRNMAMEDRHRAIENGDEDFETIINDNPNLKKYGFFNFIMNEYFIII